MPTKIVISPKTFSMRTLILATLLVPGFFLAACDNAANICRSTVTWNSCRKAAEKGDADAQLNIALMYEVGLGVAPDKAHAAFWYRKAAEQGNASAQFELGSMYLDGRGVTQDGTQAVSWLRKAAERGNIQAQYDLAYMYQEGYGVTRNDAQAAFWSSKAATHGK